MESDKVIIPFELRPIFDRTKDAIVTMLEHQTPRPDVEKCLRWRIKLIAV